MVEAPGRQAAWCRDKKEGAAKRRPSGPGTWGGAGPNLMGAGVATSPHCLNMTALPGFNKASALRLWMVAGGESPRRVTRFAVPLSEDSGTAED